MDINTKLFVNELKDNRFYNIIVCNYCGRQQYLALHLNYRWAYMFNTLLVPDKVISQSDIDGILFGFETTIEIYEVTDWVDDLCHELLNIQGLEIEENDEGKKELRRFIFDREYDIYPGDKFYGINYLQVLRTDTSILDVINRPNSIFFSMDILAEHNIITNTYTGIGGKSYLIILPFDDDYTTLFDKWRSVCIDWYSGSSRGERQIKTIKQRFRNYKIFNTNNL